MTIYDIRLFVTSVMHNFDFLIKEVPKRLKYLLKPRQGKIFVRIVLLLDVPPFSNLKYTLYYFKDVTENNSNKAGCALPLFSELRCGSFQFQYRGFPKSGGMINIARLNMDIKESFE